MRRLKVRDFEYVRKSATQNLGRLPTLDTEDMLDRIL